MGRNFGNTRFFAQVGNEERLMDTPDYPDHYRLITKAIWDVEPSITVRV
jgi:hypothetical protein